jgi:DNA-binding transcriptional ArsR family regulator
MNIKEKSTIQKVSLILKEISSPARIKILLAIGTNEACVCHLEATLGMRQAYLSQHLMALRRAGILVTNRDGRFIYYRLANTQILDVINAASDSININIENEIEISTKGNCLCPKCQHYSEVIIPS